MDERAKKILVDSIVQAGKTLLDLFRNENINNSESGNFDLKSDADRKAEDIILKAIKSAGLKCKIITEESGIIGNNETDYEIFVDPLDGTVNFSKGIPVFCSSIGVFYKKQPFLGIIYDPNQNEIFLAEKGKGATLNGEKITIKTNRSKSILINLDWFGAEKFLTVTQKLKENGIRARIQGSGVLSLCYGLIGRGEGAVLLENKPWDVAAGLVIGSELKCFIKEKRGEAVNLIASPYIKVFEELEQIVKL